MTTRALTLMIALAALATDASARAAPSMPTTGAWSAITRPIAKARQRFMAETVGSCVDGAPYVKC
jgi:hypothetical protein